jgi:hypothetical protein
MPLDPLDFASQPQFLYWNCVVLAQRMRSLMLTFVHYRRVTSTNSLLHPYLRYPHSSSFSAYYAAKQFVVYFTDELDQSLPSAATHLLSLSTELCPGTRQLTYFIRLSTSDLLALNSMSM